MYGYGGIDDLIQAALARAGQYGNAYGAFNANPGSMDPYNTPSGLKWHGTGTMGRQAIVNATKQLDAQYGKGNYSPEDREALAYQLYQGKLADYASGGNPSYFYNKNYGDYATGAGSYPEGWMSAQAGQQFGYSPEQYDALIQQYAQSFANPSAMGAGISSMGAKEFNPYTAKSTPYGIGYGTDVSHAIREHPMFAEMDLRSMGRGGFNDYLNQNFSKEEQKRLSQEVYFNNLKAKAEGGQHAMSPNYQRYKAQMQGGSPAQGGYGGYGGYGQGMYQPPQGQPMGYQPMQGKGGYQQPQGKGGTQNYPQGKGGGY